MVLCFYLNFSKCSYEFRRLPESKFLVKRRRANMWRKWDEKFNFLSRTINQKNFCRFCSCVVLFLMIRRNVLAWVRLDSMKIGRIFSYFDNKKVFLGIIEINIYTMLYCLFVASSTFSVCYNSRSTDPTERAENSFIRDWNERMQKSGNLFCVKIISSCRLEPKGPYLFWQCAKTMKFPC